MKATEKRKLIAIHFESLPRKEQNNLESVRLRLQPMLENRNPARNLRLGEISLLELLYELGRHVNRCEAREN